MFLIVVVDWKTVGLIFVTGWVVVFSDGILQKFFVSGNHEYLDC